MILGRKIQKQWASAEKCDGDIYHFHFLKLLNGTSTETKDEWTL